MAGKSTQRGSRPQSQRGDFTGRQKEVLTKEHEAAVEERREEIGLLSASQKAVKDEGVIDMMTGTPLLDHPDAPPVNGVQPPADGVGDGPAEDAVGQEPPLVVDTTQRQPVPVAPEQPLPPEGTRMGGSQASIDVYELPPERPKTAVRIGEVLDSERMNEPTLIRVEYDLDDVTIGYGNNYTFKAGYRYRVPFWVAQHLEEKALATVLSLSLTP